MRPLCYLPSGGSVVETCTRTIQGRMLLRPGHDANEIMLGVIGRALDLYHVEIYGLCFLSSHYHLLYGAKSALQMARFQNHLNSNLARKMGRLYHWRDKFWASRYRPSIVSDAPETQLSRLKYVLANGTKEHLVASPLEWPGPNMARSILHDEPLVGYWFNQTKEWAARRRREDFGRYDYATRYEIELQLLPAFRHLSKEEYQDLVLGLIVEIQEEAEAERAGRPVVGVERILAQDPHQPPRKLKKSPAPKLFFARTLEQLDAMKGEYKDFVTAYRTAADRLLTAQFVGGEFNPRFEFPQGSFPPALQFVGESLLPSPPRPPSRRLEYANQGAWRIVSRGEIPVVRVPRVSFAQPGVRCHGPPSGRLI